MAMGRHLAKPRMALREFEKFDSRRRRRKSLRAIEIGPPRSSGIPGRSGRKCLNHPLVRSPTWNGSMLSAVQHTSTRAVGKALMEGMPISIRKEARVLVLAAQRLQRRPFNPDRSANPRTAKPSWARSARNIPHLTPGCIWKPRSVQAGRDVRKKRNKQWLSENGRRCVLTYVDHL